MDAAAVIRRVRSKAGLTLREHAARAGTSHAALVAYEQGRTIPRVDTLRRILDAAGYALDLTPVVRVRRSEMGLASNEEQLLKVLDLSRRLPYQPTPELRYPPFRRTA